MKYLAITILAAFMTTQSAYAESKLEVGKLVGTPGHAIVQIEHIFANGMVRVNFADIESFDYPKEKLLLILTEKDGFRVGEFVLTPEKMIVQIDSIFSDGVAHVTFGDNSFDYSLKSLIHIND